MAQDISLLGATYSDVPAVNLPKSGGGTATFIEQTELANAGTQTPLADSGNGSAGTSTSYSREDHIHPSEFDTKFQFDGYDPTNNVAYVKIYLNSRLLPGIQWFMEDGTSQAITVWTNARLIYQNMDENGTVLNTITWTGTAS